MSWAEDQTWFGLEPENIGVIDAIPLLQTKCWQTKVGIRSFIKVVLPQLLANNYCKEEHLVDSEGNPKYNWSSKPLIFTDEGKTMVALKSNDGNYTIIPHESYMQIKKIVKENL